MPQSNVFGCLVCTGGWLPYLKREGGGGGGGGMWLKHLGSTEVVCAVYESSYNRSMREGL